MLGRLTPVMGAPFGCPRVLFVDDDQSARASFTRLFRHRGYTVDVADSGEHALQRVAKESYDVIATDLNMPGIDGLELIDRLHAAVPDVAFVLITGVAVLDLPTDSESARSIACVIRKPWDIDELCEALNRAAKIKADRREARDGALATATNRRLVLLLEDNPGDAKLVQMQLRRAWRAGYECVCADRLADALGELHARQFDVILTDLSLPDARGMDAVARLQAAAPTTPIIVLSGMSDEALAMQAVQIGAQDYIVKSELNHRSLHRCMRYAIERKRTEERLLQLAHYDQLTGLANRTLFRERASRAVARSRRSKTHPAILLLDLDHFKEVNDTLGHDAGDALLIEVANRLRTAVRDFDTVARLGGDEFVIVVEDVASRNDVTILAARIIDTLAAPFSLAKRDVPITASIGIALYPNHGEDVEAMLKSADSAMYRAKQAGRNNYKISDDPLRERTVRAAV